MSEPERIYNRLNELLQPELETMNGDEFVAFINRCFAELERREFVQHHDCRPAPPRTEDR